MDHKLTRYAQTAFTAAKRWSSKKVAGADLSLSNSGIPSL